MSFGVQPYPSPSPSPSPLFPRPGEAKREEGDDGDEAAVLRRQLRLHGQRPSPPAHQHGENGSARQASEHGASLLAKKQGGLSSMPCVFVDRPGWLAVAPPPPTGVVRGTLQSGLNGSCPVSRARSRFARLVVALPRRNDLVHVMRDSRRRVDIYITPLTSIIVQFIRSFPPLLRLCFFFRPPPRLSPLRPWW